VVYVIHLYIHIRYCHNIDDGILSAQMGADKYSFILRYDVSEVLPVSFFVVIIRRWRHECPISKIHIPKHLQDSGCKQ